jgi:hypothetical protein
MEKIDDAFFPERSFAHEYRDTREGVLTRSFTVHEQAIAMLHDSCAQVAASA